jgi:hypothetical protein
MRSWKANLNSLCDKRPEQRTTGQKHEHNAKHENNDDLTLMGNEGWY